MDFIQLFNKTAESRSEYVPAFLMSSLAPAEVSVFQPMMVPLLSAVTRLFPSALNCAR